MNDELPMHHDLGIAGRLAHRVRYNLRRHLGESSLAQRLGQLGDGFVTTSASNSRWSRAGIGANRETGRYSSGLCGDSIC